MRGVLVESAPMPPRNVASLITAEKQIWSKWEIEEVSASGAVATIAAAGDRVAGNWAIAQRCGVSVNRLAGWPRTVEADGATAWSDLADSDGNTFRLVPVGEDVADRETPGRHCWGNITVAVDSVGL